jgi:hypothetical protein
VDAWVPWLLGVLAAILLGVVTNLVYDLAKYGSVRLPRFLRQCGALPRSARAHDVTDDGVYPLVTWSAGRPLTAARLEASFVGKSRRPHILDVPEWHARVSLLQAQGEAGRTAYPIRIGVDHGEHDGAHRFRMTVAESDYAESLATMQILHENTSLDHRLHTALTAGLDRFLAVVPPTSLTASIGVISAGSRFLLLRRSLSVRTFQAQWTVGVNETMKYHDEPGASEDLFALCRRAMQEELGLTPDDYGPIVVSWFGWSRPATSFLVVATVRSKLSETEIERRRGQCHSVYEHDMVAWRRLSRRHVASVINGGPCPDGTNRWSYLAPLVVQEMWRCHHLA